MNRYIYGIAHGRDHEWEAFSLDFDLAVQGNSFEEVSKLLAEAVHAYVATAMDEPEPIRKRLLSRSVPLHLRIMWGLRIALWAMFNKRRAEESTFGFPVSCHA